MEEVITFKRRDSDLNAEREKPENEWETYDTGHRTWPSRYRCFQAYLCLMSSQSTMTLCNRIGKYRMTIIVSYLTWSIFIGAPAVLVEVMLGRFIKGNVAEAWNMCPLGTGVFACLFFITASSITSNYVFDLYLLNYFLSSLHGYVIWGTCSNKFDKINCYEVGKKAEAIEKCRKTFSKEVCGNLTWESSAAQYWEEVNDNSEISDVFIILGCLAGLVLFILFFIYKGIRSLEKLLGIFVYPSIVFWVLLVIGTFSSPITLRGFEEIFNMKWSYIVMPDLWLDGFEDTFYILGLGRIALTFVSSHGKFTDNILYDVLLVIFVTLCSCFLASIPILSVIVIAKELDGHNMSEPLFKDVKDVFVSISEALTIYPYPRTMWCAIHYLDSFLISISAQAILVLALCEALQGIFKKKEKYYFYIVIGVSLLTYIASSALAFYKNAIEVNQTSSTITIVIISTITWQMFYGIRKFNLDYFYMMGRPLPLFLKFTWITLLVLPFVGFFSKLCSGANSFFYINSGIIIIIFVTVNIMMMIRFNDLHRPLSTMFQPNVDWGPDNALLKKSRMVFDKSTVTREFMYRQELFKKPMKKAFDFKMQSIVQLI